MLKRLMTVTAAVALVPAIALAQGRPTEIGVTSGFGVSFAGGSNQIELAIPVQIIRVGFFVSDQFSVEPALSMALIKPEGIDAAYQLTGLLSGLYHLTADASRPQPYVRAQGQFLFTGSGGESASQFGVAGGIGVKLPLVPQLALRLEASFGHRFENADFFGRSTIAGLVGLSFFTK